MTILFLKCLVLYSVNFLVLLLCLIYEENSTQWSLKYSGIQRKINTVVNKILWNSKSNHYRGQQNIVECNENPYSGRQNTEELKKKRKTGNFQ